MKASLEALAPDDARALSAQETAVLLAILMPPPALFSDARPLGNTPTRVAMAWLRRAVEALLAALLALLLLFHIGFSVPDTAPVAVPQTQAAPAMSAAQQWAVSWATFLAPPVAAQGFGWTTIPVGIMVRVLGGLNSTFANPAAVATIERAAAANGLNPVLLFALIGAEHPWNLQAAYPTDWQAYAGNPFDVAVYGYWHPTGYTLAQSAEIAARTIATRLSAAPPANEPALLWVQDPHNPAGAGVYATSATWWSNTAAIALSLVRRITSQAPAGALPPATLAALSTFALAVGTTPAAVTHALALKAHGTGPLAWIGHTVSAVRTAVYQHTYAFAAGALAAGAAAFGVMLGPAAVSGMAAAVAATVADVAAAGLVVGAAAAA